MLTYNLHRPTPKTQLSSVMKGALEVLETNRGELKTHSLVPTHACRRSFNIVYIHVYTDPQGISNSTRYGTRQSDHFLLALRITRGYLCVVYKFKSKV